MAINKKYTFSFTGASALIAETLIIAEEYNKLQDWIAVEKHLVETNLLKKVKQATFKREFNEIKKRLSLLTTNQQDVLIHGSYDDTKAIILLSLAKTYALFNDFVVEIIRNKYLLFDNSLSEVDYNKFFYTKSLTHHEINEITESTAKKVKQRIFTLLEQVGLITQSKNGTILKPIISNTVLDVIIEDNPSFLAAFLYSNEEIKSVIPTLKHA